MKPEQLQEMVQWLNQQIVHINQSINKAHAESNYGRESQYEGMRDAFVRCLKKITTAE
jgi:hypothetical protein